MTGAGMLGRASRFLIATACAALLGGFLMPAYGQGLVGTDRVLCRDTVGTGQVEQCTVGGAISFTGTKGITVLPADILSGLITVDGAGSGLDADLLDGVSSLALPTLFGTTTWGSGTGFTWTFNAGATDPVITFGSDTVSASASWTFTRVPGVSLATPGIAFEDTGDSSLGSIVFDSGVMAIRADLNNIIASSQIQFAVDGTTVALVTPTEVRPAISQSGLIDLGLATAQWDDAFFAEGSVINWDNGDCILTQTGDSLDTTGCTISFASLAGAQASDADLTSWAGVTRASGFDTWAATPSMANLGSLLTDDAAGWTTFGTTPTSANLRALLTDEIGTGVLVFLGTPADDQVPVGDSASATTWRTVPDSDGATQKLQYDQATNTFSAGTDDDVPDAADYSNLTAGTGIVNSPTGTIAFSFTDKGSDVALNADECVFTSNATVAGYLVCEGDTANTIETRIAVTDPTGSDRTMTIPNADSNPVQPLTCGGSDKVSAISSAGVITCSTDSTGGGSLPADPGFDALLAWDDTAGASEWWTVGTGLVLVQPSNRVDLDADLATLSTAFATASASGAASLDFAEDTDNGSNRVRLQGAASTADVTLTLQSTTGTLYSTGGTDVALADGGTGASLTDPNLDALLFWDDSAGAIKFSAVADLNTEAAPAAGDFLFLIDAAGNLLKVNWSSLPGGGAQTPWASDIDADGFDLQFADATGIHDENDNEQLEFQTTASAVNYLDITNAATNGGSTTSFTGNPTIAAVGDDAHIGLNFAVKGGPTDPNGVAFDIGSGLYPNFRISSTNAGAGGPYIVTWHNSASPAANDELGGWAIRGNDSGANLTTYASMEGIITDPTNGSEDGHIQIGQMVNGSLVKSMAKRAGRQTIPLMAGAGVLPVGGAIAACTQVGSFDSGSNDVFMRQCSFSASADNAIYYTFFFPKAAAESTDLVAQVDWTSATTTDATDDVIWTAAAVCFSNDDAINGNAFPAVDTVTDTQTAAGDYLVSGEITAITPAGTPAEGDACVIRFTRDADNASDNFNGTADFIQARLYYVDNASSDD